MHKFVISSNTNGALRSLRIYGWFQLVAPTGFSSRNRFLVVSCSSHKATVQNCQLCRSFSVNPLSHSRRGGIIENGRPNAAGEGQDQMSGWNSFNCVRKPFSNRPIMCVVAKVQKPGFHDRIPSADCFPLSFFRTSPTKKKVATTAFGLDRKNSFTSKSRFLGLVQALVVFLEDRIHLLLPLLHPLPLLPFHRNLFESSMEMCQVTPNHVYPLAVFFSHFSFVFSNNPESMDSVSSVMQAWRDFWCREPPASRGFPAPLPLLEDYARSQWSSSDAIVEKYNGVSEMTLFLM